MSTATLEEIAELRRLCDVYKLDGRQVLARYLNSELVSIYNGAGPDSWLPLARDALTALMTLYKPLVLIHDVQFHESDGSVVGFAYTVECWRHNIRVIFDDQYPLWTLKMLYREYRLRRAYWWSVMQATTIAISGDEARKAWIDAHNRRQTICA